MKRLVFHILSCLLFATSLVAQSRVWTNNEGKTIQGTFLGQDATRVKIRLDSGKVSVIEAKTLSAEDQEFLESLPEYGLEVNSLQSSRLVAFDAADVKPDTFKVTQAYLGVGAEGFMHTLTTPQHKVIATLGVPEATLREVGESVERVWHHLGQGWPGFRKQTQAVPMLVFLPKDTAEAAALRGWMNTSSAVAVPFAWSTEPTQCAMLRVPSPAAMKVAECYRVFWLFDAEAHGKSLKWPARVHHMAISWLYQYLYRTTYVAGDDSVCVLVAGMAYAAEMEVCGKVQTFLKPPGNLKQGAWAEPVKRMVTSGGLNPNLALIMKLTTNEMSVADCALAWSLIRFLRDDGLRATRFHRYLDKLHAGGVKPSSKELAQACGYSSVADFNADWAKFLKSSQFR